MELNEILKIIDVIKLSASSDDEKYNAISELMKLYDNKPVAVNSNIQSKVAAELPTIDKENLVKEGDDQMLMNIKGICVGKKKRPDGLYQGYIKERNKRIYYYGTTKTELEFKLIQAYKENQAVRSLRKSIMSSGEKAVPKIATPKFKDYAEKWIKVYKEPNLKPRTLQNMRGVLKKPIEAFGDKPLGSIKSDEIQELLIGMEALRARDLCKGTLSQIFKKAVIQGLIDKNPCDTVELKKRKKSHRIALTKEEQEIFIKDASETAHYLLFRFILATGLRVGEALALTKDDIDFQRCCLTVNKNVVFIKDKRIVQDTPKSEAGNRTIPFPKEFAEEFRKIKTHEIFPCTYNAVNRSMQRIAKRTNLKVSAHILRHTYATRLEEAGISPKVKQYLMGHASLEMTQNVYTDVQDSYITSMYDKIREAV